MAMRYNQPQDEDSTPRTGNRHTSDANIRPDELTAYRLKQVEKALAGLTDAINGFSNKMTEHHTVLIQHERAISDLDGHKNKAIGALIVSLVGALGTALSWIIPHRGG